MAGLSPLSRLREASKLAIRGALYRANLDVGRGPYMKSLCAALEHSGIDTVLDVGANIGQYGALLRRAGFTGRIISIEPQPDAFEHLTRRAAKDDLWQVVNCAAGPGDQGTLYLAANSFSSSLLPMTDAHLAAAPGSHLVGTVSVPMSTVDELAADFQIDPEQTLLKIDTQGYEGRVLDSAARLVTSIAAVQLEMSFVELYEGQPLFDEMLKRMNAAGLHLWSLEPGISDEAGRLLQVDALLMRPPGRGVS